MMLHSSLSQNAATYASTEDDAIEYCRRPDSDEIFALTLASGDHKNLPLGGIQ
jgi:hypothetical protein